MLLNIIDGNGAAQTIIVKGQETVVDRSDTLTNGAAQEAAAENSLRSGWFFQNNGAHVMYLNDLGENAKTPPTEGDGSISVLPGTSFPPEGYPLTISAISVIGTAGEAYTMREW